MAPSFGRALTAVISMVIKQKTRRRGRQQVFQKSEAVVTGFEP
jgi:hypothetical protein